MTYGDLWYYMKTQGSLAYVYEVGERIVGFIHFKTLPGYKLFVDLVANHKDFRGKGIGAAMMRWAENYARTHELSYIELWSVDVPDRVNFYKNLGFQDLGETMNAGGTEIYRRMRRTLLYNIKPDGLGAALERGYQPG